MSYLEELNKNSLETNLKLRKEELAIREQIEDSTHELDMLDTKKSNILSSLTEIEGDLSVKKAALTELEDKVFKYKNALDILYMTESYEADFEEKKLSLSVITDEYESCKSALDGVKKEYDALSAKYSEIYSLHEQIVQDLAVKKNELSSTLTKLDQISCEVKRLDKKLLKCKQDKSNTEHELSLLTIKRNNLSSECKDIMRTNKAVQEETNKNREGAKSIVEKLVTAETLKLKETLTALKDTANKESIKILEKAKLKAEELENTVKSNLKEKNIEIESLTSEIVNLKSSKSILESEKIQLVSSIEDMSNTLEELTIQDTHLRENINQLTETLIEQDVRYKIEKLEIDIEDLTTLNKSLDQKNNDLSTVIIEKDAEIKSLIKEKGEYSDKVLRDEINKNTYTIEQLQANLKTAKEETELLKKATTDTELKKEIKKLKKELKSKFEVAPVKINDRKHDLLALSTISIAITTAYAMQTVTAPKTVDIVLVACSGGVLINTAYHVIKDFFKNRMITKSKQEDHKISLELENAALIIANNKNSKSSDETESINIINLKDTNFKLIGKREELGQYDDIIYNDENEEEIQENPNIENNTNYIETSSENPTYSTDDTYHTVTPGIEDEAAIDEYAIIPLDMSNTENEITTSVSTSKSTSSDNTEDIVQEKSESELEIEAMMQSILKGDDINLAAFEITGTSFVDNIDIANEVVTK